MVLIIKFLLGVLLIIPPALSWGGSVLLTPGYRITLTPTCYEGEVSCKKIQYHGISLKSGAQIELEGEVAHAFCADGVTPCRFIGYTFSNNGTTYTISETGMLRVTDSKDLLLQQQGKWIE